MVTLINLYWLLYCTCLLVNLMRKILFWNKFIRNIRIFINMLIVLISLVNCLMSNMFSQEENGKLLELYLKINKELGHGLFSSKEKLSFWSLKCLAPGIPSGYLEINKTVRKEIPIALLTSHFSRKEKLSRLCSIEI